MKTIEQLRVLITQDRGFYVAQCLDFDIAAQGRTLKEVKRSFEKIVVGNIVLAVQEGFKMFSNLKEPPKHLEHAFKYKAGMRETKPFNYPEFTGFDCGECPKTAEYAVS